MLKIAINLSREYVGGITSSNINLISHLYRSDYEFVGIELNERIYMKGPTLFRNFAPETFDHHIINVHHLLFPKILKKAKNISALKRAYQEPIAIIRKILKEVNPDIVLLSGTTYVPWLISIAAKQEKIPIVLWYAGILFKETETWPKNLRKILLAMERSIAIRATRVIFPSQLCKNVVEKEVMKHKILKSRVIPNPVSSIFTDPCTPNYSLERKIGAVGRYSKVKNFSAFFELHQELLRQDWRHNASFVTNPNTKLENMPKTIEVFPPMTSEELKKFYLFQCLIVCPSLFETFGNVPMEAACLGVPVLVSDKMGCAEVLKEVGLGNMVISFNDIEKVAQRVKELCGQQIMPKQLNALKMILDNRFVSEKINAILINAANKKTNSNQNNGQKTN